MESRHGYLLGRATTYERAIAAGELGKKLTDAIEARLYQRPAKHATVRAAMLLQGEEIVHVDGHLPRTDGADSINGRVVVFTDKSICIIDLAGVASMRAFGADQAGVVNTTVLDRRALKRIEILQAAEGDNAHINSGITGSRVTASKVIVTSGTGTAGSR